jgi:hypothetical protein
MEHATYGGLNPGKGPRLVLRPALGAYYLPPSDACPRHTSLASGRRRAHTVSLPTTPSDRTRKSGPLQPEHATWHMVPGIFAQSKLAFWRNLTKGRYTGTRVNAVWGRCPTACAFFWGVKLGVYWASCAERGTADRLPSSVSPGSPLPIIAAYTYLKQHWQPMRVFALPFQPILT